MNKVHLPTGLQDPEFKAEILIGTETSRLIFHNVLAGGKPPYVNVTAENTRTHTPTHTHPRTHKHHFKTSLKICTNAQTQELGLGVNKRIQEYPGWL